VFHISIWGAKPRVETALSRYLACSCDLTWLRLHHPYYR